MFPVSENWFEYVTKSDELKSVSKYSSERAKKVNVPIISCMGTGNKLHTSKFEIADIYKTTICPLSKGMRKELRKRNQ